MTGEEYQEISEDLQRVLTHLSGFSQEELANKEQWLPSGSQLCKMMGRCYYCHICDANGCRWVQMYCVPLK